MPYNTVVTFSSGNALAAADLNNNFANLDYLNAKINTQIQVPGASMTPSSTSGAAYGAAEMTTNKDYYRFMDFSDSGGKLYAEFGFVLPSDYDSGTMTALFHWTANSSSTNSVVWGAQAVCFADNSSLDAAFGTAQEVTDANGSSAYTLRVTSATAAITISGTPTPGKWVQWRVYRDSANGSDTLAATARLLGVVLTYTRS